MSESSGPDDALVAVAAAYGVATDFWDWQGQHVVVSDATVRAVLTALGVDVSTPAGVRAAAEEVRLRDWRRVLPACVVTRQNQPRPVAVHVRDGEPVRTWVVTEDGATLPDLAQQDLWVDPREVDGGLVGEATFVLPADLPLGWHVLHAASPSRTGAVPLIVTPSFLGLPASLGDGRAWGFMTQLYSVRSEASWGQGDLADLAELVRWSGEDLGAGYVLVNPLHATDPVPPLAASPYLPATRRFFSPLYLRVEDVPEHAALPPGIAAEVARLGAGQRAADRTDDQLDRDAVWAAKEPALTLLHARPRTPEREAAYRRFREREGVGLRDYATWCALAEVHGLPWQDWPAELQDNGSAAVADAREEHADRVDFHCWLQWLIEEQLAAVQQAAEGAGMPLGVVHDLAVGVHPSGADTWALREVMAQGVGVGAPPDAFNQQGQDWSQPPWRPDALAETGYAAYRDMLRTILRHAGGLRVDHIIGLFRLWWVPAGSPPDQGTYVRYDHEALVGILALEAHRAGATVIGEDLGTVEPWVRGYLADRGILGTSILWFEYDEHGQPLPPERWRELCLAAVTTHDLPPTAGYLAGEHIRIRDELGLLTRPVEEERAHDAHEQRAWRRILNERGLLPGEHAVEQTDEQGTVEALHAALLLSPARLLGVALGDAVGDRRTMNQPGTDRAYPNWRLPLADGSGHPLVLADVEASPRAAALARVLAPATARPVPAGSPRTAETPAATVSP